MLCIFRNEYVPPIELLAILKAHIPQRRDEMLRRDGRESRKKYMDGIWLNPTCYSKWEISSEALNRRTFNDYPVAGSRSKRSEVVDIRKDEDIVCALPKGKGARKCR